jgi:hypothetical protein
MKVSITSSHLAELPPLIAFETLLGVMAHQDCEFEINLFPTKPVLLTEIFNVQVSI